MGQDDLTKDGLGLDVEHGYQHSQGTTSIKLGKSRQVTALAFKTISYQRRQWFTNICCITLCPFMMVFIAALLSNFISALIAKANPVSEYLYCSNVSAMSDIKMPIFNETDTRLPKTKGKGVFPNANNDQVINVNFAEVVSLKITGPPGASALKARRPCVFWFRDEYPTLSVYEPLTLPNVTGKFRRDSSFMAQPSVGWLQALAIRNASLVDPRAINVFTTNQQRNWVVYGADPSVDLSLLGEKPKQKMLSVAEFFRLNESRPSRPVNGSFGILEAIPTRYYSDFSEGGVQPVPWYEYVSGNEDALDDAVGAALQKAIDAIAALDKSAISGSRNLTASTAFFLKANKALEVVPYGGIFFTLIDHKARKYSYTMNFGRDIRLDGSSSFPDPGQRAIYHITSLSNSFLQNSNITRFSNASITQGVRLMPVIKDNALNFAFGSLFGSVLYPFGVSFLLPIFVIVLVQEKEARVFMLMKMNGMSSWAYYASHYITFYLLFALSSAVFLLTGYFSNLTLFTKTDASVLLILFFLWGHAQIALAFFFSVFFNRSRLSLVIVFLLVLCSVIVSYSTERLYMDKDMPFGLFIWPPFAFYRALATVNIASFAPDMRPVTLSDLKSGTELFSITIFLAMETIGYLLLAGYLGSILPSEFGLRRPWYFPISEPWQKLRSAQRAKQNDGFDPKSEEALAAMALQDTHNQILEDDDVKAERKRVLEIQDKYHSPLIMKRMRKVYAGRGGAGPKLAVKDVTFAVERGIVFGLLGPNGAGKTTLISILTGLYEASSGVAFLGGYNIATETKDVYKCIGVCPQFDIFWEDLTVGEHLYFLARLKGVPRHLEKLAVQESLMSVALLPFENRLTKGLSGGEKRRLSIAMALIGTPQVVFLDEPTTGLDPEVRRLIWNIINEAKRDKTIVLTTHSMEEAEVLCSRIGIMAKGTLRCIANPIRLKELYGSGFRLYMNTLPEETNRACEFVESLLPKGYQKVDAFATSTTYEFPLADGVISFLFQQIESNKTKYGITDWGMGQTSLEEVFVNLISEADATAEA